MHLGVVLVTKVVYNFVSIYSFFAGTLCAPAGPKARFPFDAKTTQHRRRNKLSQFCVHCSALIRLPTQLMK